MSTEQNPATTPQEGGAAAAAQKVEFSAEQQAKVQELIDSAVGRVAGKIRSEYEPKVADLQRQLDDAKKPKQHGKEGDGDANLDEYKRVIEQAKQEAERFRTMAQEREREIAAAREESLSIRKEVAIAEAASEIPFFNLGVVKTLTKDNIQWDAERGQFVVRGENGQIRLDSTLEKPLSLKAYFTEFASNNKYLVRADVKQGSGSSESSRSSVASNGRYEVTDIFGPKSDSRKAAALMKDNPQEYKRLKGLAKEGGLIA